MNTTCAIMLKSYVFQLMIWFDYFADNDMDVGSEGSGARKAELGKCGVDLVMKYDSGGANEESCMLEVGRLIREV